MYIYIYTVCIHCNDNNYNTDDNEHNDNHDHHDNPDKHDNNDNDNDNDKIGYTNSLLYEPSAYLPNISMNCRPPFG